MVSVVGFEILNSLIFGGLSTPDTLLSNLL
jgi:hypothetical protein